MPQKRLRSMPIQNCLQVIRRTIDDALGPMLLLSLLPSKLQDSSTAHYLKGPVDFIGDPPHNVRFYIPTSGNLTSYATKSKSNFMRVWRSFLELSVSKLKSDATRNLSKSLTQLEGIETKYRDEIRQSQERRAIHAFPAYYFILYERRVDQKELCLRRPSDL